MTTTVLPGLLRRYRAPGHTAVRHRIDAAVRWLHQALCAVGGHHFMICRERLRIRLECADCGYQTPGWLLTPSAAGSGEIAPGTRKRLGNGA